MFKKIFILVFVLVLSFSLFVYAKDVLYNSAIVEENTEDFKIYKNEKYGYQIKYPSELTGLIIYDDNLENVSFGSEAIPYVNISAYSLKQNMDFQSQIQEILITEFHGLLTYEDITWIDGFPRKFSDNAYAIDIEFENVVGGYTGRLVWTFAYKGNKMYKISALTDYGDMSQKKVQELVLSAFEFTK